MQRPLRLDWSCRVGCDNFLYSLKAGPAGGRLRRSSSAGSTTAGNRPTLNAVTAVTYSEHVGLIVAGRRNPTAD
jgi:hypothetical protein